MTQAAPINKGQTPLQGCWLWVSYPMRLYIRRTFQKESFIVSHIPFGLLGGSNCEKNIHKIDNNLKGFPYKFPLSCIGVNYLSQG